MRRRSVIIGGLAGLFLAPEHAYTQQPSTKIPRVGIVTQAATDKNDPRFDAFRERLHDLGYVEGRNIILEFRFTAGDISRSRQLASELVALPVDVLVPEGAGTAWECRCSQGASNRLVQGVRSPDRT
jgi:putative ABC transport system substrate-binding protein